MSPGSFIARPLTPATWPDLEQLFGLPGGSMVRGCWCMFYRISGKPPWGEPAKQALAGLVEDGIVPGLLGYVDGSPAGWISLGPRGDYQKLRRSPIMKPIDDLPAWSVVCSYVAKPHRGQGVQHRLLAAAIEFARNHGVTMLEAYPVDRSARGQESIWFGSRGLYEQAGFTEVVRRSPTRVVMRKALAP